MNNNEELINKDAKNTAELISDDELDRVSGGMGDWPAVIEKVAGMFLNSDYDEVYIMEQCIMMGLDFEKVKACAEDLGYI